MKREVLYVLAFLALLQLATAEVKAQDGLPNPELNGYLYQDANPYDEKPLLMEGELRNSGKIVRDSTVTIKSGSAKTAGRSGASDAKKSTVKSGDDPLNFNFLYYIIQKFKTSDLIEEE
ncbi:MAG: hypothetical protein ACOYXA_11765 [Bacteroidota bacterium]